MLDRFFQFLLDRKVCQGCENLKAQLASVNDQNRKMLDSLIGPKMAEEDKPREFKPIQPKTIPWSVKRQMLEREDREKIEKRNEELEGELNAKG